MNLKGKKIVVVGGAGLIGSHTVDKLVKEDVKEIVIYDNFVRGVSENIEASLRDPRVKVFEDGGDILHTDLLNKAFEGADGVFHFAALWLLQCLEYPRAAFDVNIQGTFNVLEACVDNNVKRLVFSSSASVYGEALKEPMTEDHPFNNKTFYGASKIAGEAMATSFYDRHDLSFAGLRYMNVYGPRQDYNGAYIAVIMKMLDAIDQGKPMQLYGDGSQAYDFIYVEDCATANVCAMKSDTEGQFYNVCTGKRTSILELAQILQKLTGTSDNIEFLRDGQSFVKNRLGCPEKAKSEISFEASASLEEGLKKLIEWRKSHIDQVKRKREKVAA